MVAGVLTHVDVGLQPKQFICAVLVGIFHSCVHDVHSYRHGCGVCGMWGPGGIEGIEGFFTNANVRPFAGQLRFTLK